MESNTQLRDALTARSEIASLEELESRGKQRVKIIRADHIAEMLDEASRGAGEDSMPREDVDRLLANARAEFEAALVQRQHRISELDEELATTQDELAATRERLAHFEALLPGGAAAVPPAQAPAGGTTQASLEAASGTAAPGAAGTPAAPPPAGGGDLASALDSLGDAMNQRLDQMSKKLGISTAVEGAEVHLDGLFGDDDDVKIESNMDDLQVKKTTGSGIGANLERLKKLKGGG